MTRSRNPYSRPDARTRAAKAAGYPARSVHKLKEIERRCQLFRSGQRVLDLGAAPGSWAKLAGERVGARGRVVALDKKAISEALGDRVTVLAGDVAWLAESSEPAVPDLENERALEMDRDAAAAPEAVRALVERHAPYDVVLSDMAPHTTGAKFADAVRSFELFMQALEVAGRLGKPGSSFVAKIFMGGDFEEARDAVRVAYRKCRIIRPSSTRSNSTEVFVVGLQKNPSSTR